MRWLKYLIILAILTTLIYYLQDFFYTRKEKFKKLTNNQLSEVVDYRASFAVYTDGIFRVFTSPKYHNLSQDVFITSESPNIVVVKKRSTWGDFFDTLPMELSRECLETGDGQRYCTAGANSLKFYLNAKRNDNLLDEEIRDGDRALISFGDEEETEIKIQLKSIPNSN